MTGPHPWDGQLPTPDTSKGERLRDRLTRERQMLDKERREASGLLDEALDAIDAVVFPDALRRPLYWSLLAAIQRIHAAPFLWGVDCVYQLEMADALVMEARREAAQE